MPASLTATTALFSPDDGGQAVAQAGDNTIYVWNGANDQGQWVTGGSYTLVLTLTDSYGHVTVLTAGVQVVRAAGDEIRIYNTAGEIVKTLRCPPAPGTPAGRLGINPAAFVPVPGQSWVVFDTGNTRLAWDGRNDLGNVVQSGTYLAQASVWDAATLATIHLDGSLTVLDPGSALLAAAILAPNPARLGRDSAIKICLPGASPDDWQGSVYGLSGEKVADLLPSAPGCLAWDLSTGRPSGGIYLVELRAKGPGGTWERRILKCALQAAAKE